MENNNTCNKTELHEIKTVQPHTNMPAVLAVTDLDNGGPIDFTSVALESTNTVSGQASFDGFTMKQKAIVKQVSAIRMKFWKELALSIVRNILYWSAVLCIFILLANISEFSDWSKGAMAVLFLFIVFGFLGVGFHVAYVCTELSPDSGTSVLGSMLFSPVTRVEFQQLMINRQLSAPEIFFEISLRSTACVSISDENHWTRVAHKTRHEMAYRGWADQSSSVQEIPWPTGRATWMVVAKDFRCVDPQSQITMDAEMNEFQCESGFDPKCYSMSFDLSLQWKEHDSCFDAEPFFVVEDKLPILYHIYVYKIALFFGLDALYRLLFLLSVKRLEDYYIVKFIEK